VKVFEKQEQGAYSYYRKCERSIYKIKEYSYIEETGGFLCILAE